MIPEPSWYMRPVIWVLEKVMGLAAWRDWRQPEDPFDPTRWFDTVTFTATAPWFDVDDGGIRRMTFPDGTTLEYKRNGESVVKW